MNAEHAHPTGLRYANFVKQAKQELKKEKEETAVVEIKEKIREIESAERILDKLNNQYNDLLDQEV